MDRTKYRKLLTKTIDQCGLEHQSRICIEEMSELTKALCKWFRGRDEGIHGDTITLLNLKQDIVDEIADVQICLDEMIMGYDIGREVNERIIYKMERLEARLGSHRDEL